MDGTYRTLAAAVLMIICAGFSESTPIGMRNDLAKNDSNLGKDSLPDHESPRYGAAGALQDFVEMKKSKGWDYRLTPVENADEPVVVNISLYITNMVDLKEADMEYTVEMYLRQEWRDYRLEFDITMGNVSSVAVPDPFYSDIWLPDTFIQNGKHEETHDVTQENRGFRVYQNGSILYSQRLTARVWCKVHLESFPMDKQACDLRIMTYRYDVHEMTLKWKDTSPLSYVPLDLVKYDLEDVDIGICTQDFVHAGSYSCLKATFYFDRRLGYFMTQIYIPSCLLVVISWISFWLDSGSAPARVSLGILTILTMNNQMSSVASSSLPKVSYIKAIDVWITVCMCFLFASLLEFAIVNTMSRRSQDQKLTQSKKNRNEKDYQAAKQTKYVCGLPYITSKMVDKTSRIMFPVTFATFVVVYWIAYCV